MWLSGFLFTDVLPPTFACSASFLCLRAATFLIRLWGWRREGDGEEGREPRNDKRRKEGRKGEGGEGEGRREGRGGRKKEEMEEEERSEIRLEQIHRRGCVAQPWLFHGKHAALPPCVSSSAGVFPKATHFSQFADTQYNSTDLVRCI